MFRGLGEYFSRDALNASSLIGLVTAVAVFNRRVGSLEDSRDVTTKSLARIETSLEKLDAKVAGQGERLEKKIAEQGEKLEKKIAEQGEKLEKKIAEQGEKLEKKIAEQGEKLEKKIDAVAANVISLRTRVAFLQGARSERSKLLRLGADQPDLDLDLDDP